MTDRERIEIGGVTDVLRFDEEGVAVDTTCGLLIIKGRTPCGAAESGRRGSGRWKGAWTH